MERARTSVLAAPHPGHAPIFPSNVARPPRCLPSGCEALQGSQPERLAKSSVKDRGATRGFPLPACQRDAASHARPHPAAAGTGREVSRAAIAQCHRRHMPALTISDYWSMLRLPNLPGPGSERSAFWEQERRRRGSTCGRRRDAPRQASCADPAHNLRHLPSDRVVFKVSWGVVAGILVTQQEIMG